MEAVLGDGIGIDELVQSDRVHRRVYTDPEIFDLEMDRLFGTAWIYIGHDSQVRKPGDYYCTRIGHQPVVLVRHSAGDVRVLHNRCGHRGAVVVAPEHGNADEFRCCYHGWTYETDGRLKSLPVRQGYPEGTVDVADPSYGMQPVARVDSYRGFVFASLSSTGPSLVEYLGHMTTSFDDLVDRAPDGEIEVAGGIARHLYRGNWKLIFENVCDGLHPTSVHLSSIEAAREQDDAVFSDGAGEIGVRQMRQNGAPLEFWDRQVGLWAYPNGHAYLGDYHDDEKLVVAQNDPSFGEYVAAMEAGHGENRARRILGVTRWNTNIYPTISFMSQFRQLRVIRPVSVDRTEVLGFCFRLKGAPDKMFHDTIRFANITNATGSPVLTDDLETYDRLRGGLESEGNDWIPMSRGAGRDEPDGHGGLQAENGLSELHIRNMFAAWSACMTGMG
jgi:phenylpropionate dioxygenase-like ring-hydroxylating dioxygenase large terminal subunit